jgi:predicted TPR repeat methyltransferase
MADDEHGWLRTPLTDPAEIERYYDDWVDTYDRQLAEWGYEAPHVAAELLVQAAAAGPVLDVGCGTGLVGRALRQRGVIDIDGIDLSSASIDAALATGAYRSARQHNLDHLPLPHDDDTFSGAICVGVLSYVADLGALIADLCRVLSAGSPFVATYRSDLFVERNITGLVQELVARGLLCAVSWSDVRPYMPGNPDFGEAIGIRYGTLVVA